MAGISVLLRAADPPALAREPVGLAHDEHGQLGLTARFRLVVHVGKDLAQRTHLGPCEVVTEQAEHFRIADGLACFGGRDKDGADFRRIGKQPGFAHP